MSPSSTRSSTPVTVTVCGTFQSAAVNVRLAAETVPSVVSLEATGMTTSAVGSLVRTTVKLAVPPASVVPRPATGRHGDAGRVVVGVGHRHIGRIDRA
jgi:hypothetical protein